MAPAKSQTLHLTPSGDGKYVIRLQRESVSAVKELLTSRLTEMNRATELVRSDLVRVPSEVDVKLGGAKEKIFADMAGLKELFAADLRTVGQQFVTVNKQLETIQVQFKEKGLQVDENKAAAAKSVADAFAAAEKVGQEQNRNFKEIVEKSERGTQKVIDQISVQLGTVQKSLDDKVAELRETVTRLETTITNANTNANTNRTERHESGSNIIALVFGIVMAVVAVGALLIGLLKR
jgi:hypothetical protein